MTDSAVQTTFGPGQSKLGYAYRFLKIFTEIKPGEAVTAFLMAFNIFLLLLAYYLIKPVREEMMLSEWGPLVKSYLASAQVILFIFVIKGFSRLASKVPRQLLITWVTAFFISNLGLFCLFFLWGMPRKTMAIVFYIWVGIFNIMVVAQFWSFANDIYSEEAGKRLFPMIAVGQACGAFFGSSIARIIIRPLGTNYESPMMLITGGILVICIALTIVVHNREIKEIRQRAAQADSKTLEEGKAKERPLKKGGGFRLILKSRFLLFYSLLIFSLNYVNYMGESIFSQSANHAVVKAIQLGTTGGLSAAQFTGIIYSDYQFLYNLIALLIQLFLVSRIFKWVGVNGALLILPFIALGGYSLVGLLGASLVLVKWVKGIENGIDYSLMNTTKGALFLITSREEKYKGKAAAESFFYRSGDALAGLSLFVGVTFLRFTPEKFAGLNIIMTLVWITFCFLVIRQYNRIKAKLAGTQT